MRTRREIETFNGLLKAVARDEETPLLDWLGEQDDPRLWIDSLYHEAEKRHSWAESLANRIYRDVVEVDGPVWGEEELTRLMGEAARLRRAWKEAEALFPAPAEEIPF